MNRKDLLKSGAIKNMTEFEKIDQIIDALEYLKQEAASTAHEDFRVLIDSFFNIALIVFVNSIKENVIEMRTSD